MNYYFVKFLCILINFLPRSVAIFIGTWIGRLCWYILPEKRKKLLLGNIARGIGFDESGTEREAKKCIEHFGRMVLEFAQLAQITNENIDQYIKLEGTEHLQEALSHGKGAILLTGHLGNWEWLAKAVVAHGFTLYPVVKKQHNLQMDKLINETRKNAGMHIIYMSNMKEMLRALQKNAILGLVADQDAGKNGVWVEFMGRMASTPEGVAAFARMKGSPIVPAFALEERPGYYRGVIQPYFWAENTADKEKDIVDTTAKAAQIVEKAIRQSPYQWFWLHNRWKSTPPENIR